MLRACISRFVNTLLPPLEQEHQATVALLSMSWASVQNALTQPGFAMRMRRMAVASSRNKLVVPFARLEAIRVRCPQPSCAGVHVAGFVDLVGCAPSVVDH